MIVFVNPRATRPKNRRFPLSVMSVAAMLPEHITWEIVDGNRPGVEPLDVVSRIIRARGGGPDPVKLVAMTVMPGPQLVHAVPIAKGLKQRHPNVPIVWGGISPVSTPPPC